VTENAKTRELIIKYEGNITGKFINASTQRQKLILKDGYFNSFFKSIDDI